MNTAQVAKTVSPSVVVITTEQVVYSQWSLFHGNLRHLENPTMLGRITNSG